MHKIEIDDEVLEILKMNAEPFKDTHNSVLKRLLLKSNSLADIPKEQNEIDEFSITENSVPAALQQILEVIYLVIKRGYGRIEATNRVAQKRHLAPQTVLDKYCRQLNKKAYEIDRFLEGNLPEFQKLLRTNFPEHLVTINNFFAQL